MRRWALRRTDGRTDGGRTEILVSNIGCLSFSFPILVWYLLACLWQPNAIKPWTPNTDILFWTLHCTLYCKLKCTLSCSQYWTINCTPVSKPLHEFSYSLRNNPQKSTIKWTLYRPLYCKVNCALFFYTVPYTKLSKNFKVAGWAGLDP